MFYEAQKSRLILKGNLRTLNDLKNKFLIRGQPQKDIFLIPQAVRAMILDEGSQIRI